MAWKRKQLTEAELEALKKKKAGLLKLSEQISKMSDVEKKAFCKFLDSKMGGVPVCTGERVLSPFNSCLLVAQKPDVTVVGGYVQWQKVGRQVKEGKGRGLAIWVRTNSGKTTEAVIDDVTHGENPHSKPGFILVSKMFDISDTVPIGETDEKNNALVTV